MNYPPVAPRAVPSPVELPAARPDAAPSVTLSRKQLLAERKRDVRLNGERPPEPPYQRPRTRGDCFGGERPCPFVGCKYHTYLDVTEAGSLVINRPDVDVAELKASCSLDIADQGSITLEQVGQVLNVTRERVRQVQAVALKNVAARLEPKFRGSCKARCAESGRQCRLPAHGPEVMHRHERGSFRLVAAEGQTVFAEKQRLENEARRVPTSAIEAAHV